MLCWVRFDFACHFYVHTKIKLSGLPYGIITQASSCNFISKSGLEHLNSEAFVILRVQMFLMRV